jgi:hypothetical protein
VSVNRYKYLEEFRQRGRANLYIFLTGVITVANAVNESAGNGVDDSKRKLSQIFRPPYAIMHSGTFAEARDTATKEKKWLLVNIRDDSFPCMLMDR